MNDKRDGTLLTGKEKRDDGFLGADGLAVCDSAGTDAPSALKRPHFLDLAGQGDAQVQLRTTDLFKSYRKGQVEVHVLQGVSLEVRQGELLAIVGQSGSGKSTLLHLLGTLDAPDKGEIHYAGQRIDNLASKGRDRLRNSRFGMIFQFYHLLPELNTLENVLAPLMISHGVWSYLRHRAALRAKAKELLELVGLSHRLKHRPRELSGGEMQRAAIARALITQPDLLLADEPTGNLDQSTGQEIIRILSDLNRRQNLTIVMVTHDRAIADQADRIVRLVNGRIEQ
jgi:lipoprotein-releasing system ATP-binding protein